MLERGRFNEFCKLVEELYAARKMVVYLADKALKIFGQICIRRIRSVQN